MSINIRVSILAIGVALLISLCSCAEKIDKDDSNTASASEVSEVSPNALLGKFTTTDLDGNTVTESVIGECELTMVNIWGTFCNPCLNEMPDLGELAAEYADRGFQIIGIVSDATDSKGNINQSTVDYAKELVGETGADYLHIVPCDELNSAKLNDVIYIPETFFLDKNGNIVGEPIIGSNKKDKWIEIIEEKFAELGLESEAEG